MGNSFFNEYPYTDFHELNLSWVIKELRTFATTLEQFVSTNALKYADPIQWNITTQYEKNTIVIDPQTGTAYISVAPVPAGVALTNEDYWTIVFDLSSFVTKAAQNLANKYEPDTTLTATFDTNAGEWLVYGDILYKALIDIHAGDQYTVGSNIEHFTIEEFIPEYFHDEIVAGLNAVFNDVVVGGTLDTEALNSANDMAVTVGTDMPVTVGNDMSVTADNDITVTAGEDIAITTTSNVDVNGNVINIKATGNNNALNLEGDLSINGIKYNPADYVVYVMSAYGFVGDDDTINDTKWAELIAEINGAPAVVVCDKGIYKFTAITIPSNVTVKFVSGQMDGAITISGWIDAGRYKIFTDYQNVTCPNESVINFPEWYGVIAHDQDKASDNRPILEYVLNTMSEVSLEWGYYWVDDVVTILTSNHHIHGMEWNEGRSSIMSTSTTSGILQIGNDTITIAEAPGNIRIENVNIAYPTDRTSVNCIALKLVTIKNTIIKNCWVNRGHIGIQVSNTLYTKLEDIHFTCPNINGARCIEISTQTTVTHFSNIGENASLYITGCACTLDHIVATTYGIYVRTTDRGLADTYIDNLSFSRFYYGIYIDAQDMTVYHGNQNIRIVNLIFEQMVSCIKLVNNHPSHYSPFHMLIDNCYFNGTAETQFSPVLIDFYSDLTNSYKFVQAIITGCVLVASDNSTTQAMIMNCRSVTVKNCAIRNMSRCLSGRLQYSDIEINLWNDTYLAASLVNMAEAVRCTFKVHNTGYVQPSGGTYADYAFSGTYSKCLLDVQSADRSRLTAIADPASTSLADLANFTLNTDENAAIGL